MLLKKFKRIYKVALNTVKSKSNQAQKMEEKNSDSQSIFESLKAHPKVKIRDTEALEKKVLLIYIYSQYWNYYSTSSVLCGRHVGLNSKNHPSWYANSLLDSIWKSFSPWLMIMNQNRF